jgi:hypothetical protein
MPLNLTTVAKIRELEELALPENKVLAMNINDSYDLRFNVEHPDTKATKPNEKRAGGKMQFVVRNLHDHRNFDQKLITRKAMAREILDKMLEYDTVDLCLKRISGGVQGKQIVYSISKVDSAAPVVMTNLEKFA